MFSAMAAPVVAEGATRCPGHYGVSATAAVQSRRQFGRCLGRSDGPPLTARNDSGDLVDQQRPEGRRQVMSHARHGDQPGAGDSVGDRPPTGHVHQRIVRAVNDESRHLHPTEAKRPVRCPDDGQQLPQSSPRVRAAVKGARAQIAQPLRVARIGRTADGGDDAGEELAGAVTIRHAAAQRKSAQQGRLGAAHPP